MAQSTADGAERRAAVIGAGIIGTCCALYLQREGFQVTLIDKGAPGEGCTLGNSGGLGIASVVPLSVPGILAKVPRMLLDPLQPLTIRWADLPRSLPWLIRFLANSARGRVEEVADARNALLSKLFDAYAPLLAEAGAEDLIKRNGALSVHERENGHAADHYETDLRRRRGIRVEAVSGDEVREMEPALGPAIKGGLFFPDNGPHGQPATPGPGIRRTSGAQRRDAAARDGPGLRDGSGRSAPRGDRRRRPRRRSRRARGRRLVAPPGG